MLGVIRRLPGRLVILRSSVRGQSSLNLRETAATTTTVIQGYTGNRPVRAERTTAWEVVVYGGIFNCDGQRWLDRRVGGPARLQP
jgi:hypothetical protein